jgi:hypothetical protein
VIDYVARALRPRSRLADHHLRHHGGEGRRARRRPRARPPYGFVDGIAKLIPFELDITLDDDSAAARRRSPSSSELIRATTRRRGARPDRPGALARGPDAQRRQARRRRGDRARRADRLRAAVLRGGGETASVTQFDKDDVEAIGLVKFDFLGLRTLTIIDWAVQAINAPRRRRRGAARHRRSADGRRPTYRCSLQRRHGRGVPARIARHEGPDQARQARHASRTSSRWSRCSARARCSRAWSTTSSRASTAAARPIDLPASRARTVLKPTYGVIVYQEQVMQIAQVLAGYTLGGADLLRRAMGKKKPEEMAKQRSIFVEGAPKRGVDASQGRRDLRPDGEVRRLRLQQVALGGLRAGGLPDRLAEGALPGGVHGRGAVGRHEARHNGPTRSSATAMPSPMWNACCKPIDPVVRRCAWISARAPRVAASIWAVMPASAPTRNCWARCEPYRAWNQ